MPVFSILVLVFILSNFGFPGTINFVGEFLILSGGIIISPFLMFLSAIALIFSLIFSLNFFTKLFFGYYAFNFFRFYADINRLEFFILFSFFCLVFLGGLICSSIFGFINLRRWFF